MTIRPLAGPRAARALIVPFVGVLAIASVGGCAAALNGAGLQQQVSALELENRQLLQQLTDLREDLAAARAEREEALQQLQDVQAELDRARGVRR